jgi:LAGLIDADG DNA endonuclease family
MFYPEGKKIIPSNIKFYLTPIALAQLIMDDGT